MPAPRAPRPSSAPGSVRGYAGVGAARVNQALEFAHRASCLCAAPCQVRPPTRDRPGAAEPALLRCRRFRRSVSLKPSLPQGEVRTVPADAPRRTDVALPDTVAVLCAGDSRRERLLRRCPAVSEIGDVVEPVGLRFGADDAVCHCARVTPDERDAETPRRNVSPVHPRVIQPVSWSRASHSMSAVPAVRCLCGSLGRCSCAEVQVLALD